MFENIEELFQKLRDINEYSRALVTLTTAVGALFILYHTTVITVKSLQGKFSITNQSC